MYIYIYVYLYITEQPSKQPCHKSGHTQCHMSDNHATRAASMPQEWQAQISKLGCLADRRAKLLGGQTSQAPSPLAVGLAALATPIKLDSYSATRVWQHCRGG